MTFKSPHPYDVGTVTIRRNEFDEVRHDVKQVLENQHAQQSRLAVMESEFATVKRIVYGGVGLVLSSVAVGLIALVVVK